MKKMTEGKVAEGFFWVKLKAFGKKKSRSKVASGSRREGKLKKKWMKVKKRFVINRKK